MAKRARGSVRPGQRRPIERRPAPAAAPAPAPTPRPTGLSEAELVRAAEIEAMILAEEKAAATARQRSGLRSASPAEMTRTASLISHDAEEYAYVARDVREIVKIAALLLAILFVLYILVDVAGVFKVS